VLFAWRAIKSTFSSRLQDYNWLEGRFSFRRCRCTKSTTGPHIVWFGEEVPALEEACLTATADFFAVIGTSYKFILRLA
jgi:NAD-dependent SIR2 family protein deacetylase